MGAHRQATIRRRGGSAAGGGAEGLRLRVLAIAAGALALAAAVGALALHPAHELETLPIRAVHIGGELRHVSRSDLESVIEHHLGTGFLGVDVDAVAGAAMELPWVASVSVRRVWPDSLRIAVIEQEAVARWPDGGLLAAGGHVFRPRRVGEVEHLPQLSGPDDAAAPQVLAAWREASRALAAVCPRIAQMQLSPRGIWRIGCDGGPRITLREGQLGELAALSAIYPRLLGARSNEVLAIDLRYANGFAVRWKPRPPERETATAGKTEAS